MVLGAGNGAQLSTSHADRGCGRSPSIAICAKLSDGIRSIQKRVALGIRFPLLEDPINGVAAVLMGQTQTLIEFTANINLPLINIDLASIPVFPGITIVFAGQLGVLANLTAGYDTNGLQKLLADPNATSKAQADLLDGLYVGDNSVVGITGGVTASADFSIPLVSISNPTLTSSACYPN